MKTMVAFEIKIVVNRPVEEVFAFISNAENLPRWRAATLEVTPISSGASNVGSVFKGRFTFLGRHFEGNLEVIAREPHQRYATKMVGGPFPLEAHYTLEQADGGTRLTLMIQGEPGGFFKLAEPLVVSMARRSYESDLHNLKEMLEAQAVQASQTS
jgi:carbon monoxide dehydrogenase subunit G